MAREEGFFDELARGLADGTLTRGKALRLMGAALVGGTLGSLGGVAVADDECKPLNKKCRKDKQCCTGLLCDNGKCATCRSNGGPCARDAECCSIGFGGGCRNGTCVESCIQPSLTPCDPNDPSACGGPESGCNCLPEASSDKTYCRSDVTTAPCTTSCDCLSGQFCEPFGDDSFCVAVCPGS
jgi:hypothetical protein